MRTPVKLAGVATPGSTPGGKRTCGGCHLCVNGPISAPDPGTIFLPGHFVVEITNQCNLDCIMCERKLVQPDDLMNDATFNLVADKFFDFPIAIELSGLGEPTLAPGFPWMAREVYDRRKILYFPTNGAGLLKPAVLEALEDGLQTHIGISIDAATAATYGKVRTDKKGRPGDFLKLVKEISDFRAAKPNIWLQTAFTAGGYNVDEFPAFVKMAAELGFNEVSFKPVRCWAIPVAENSLRFRKDQTERALNAAAEIAAQTGIGFKLERPQYSEGFENSGHVPGFIPYLDIIPLDIFECGSGGSGSETTTSEPTGTSIGRGESVGEPQIGPQTIRSPRREREKKLGTAKRVLTSDVMVALTDGTITSCGAKHPIGHVLTDDYPGIVMKPEVQAHYRARGIGDPSQSQWCRGCEKMM